MSTELRIRVVEKCLLNNEKDPSKQEFGERISLVTIEAGNLPNAITLYDEMYMSDDFKRWKHRDGDYDQYPEVIIFQDFEESVTYGAEIVQVIVLNSSKINISPCDFT